ncbi:MAG TPA: GGDEF domain-containing protein [Solirubrobacteraceae bacterium]|nr:GGDEF domain-containing protein [Solirubrobacteraceae bacterium]
MGNGGTAPDQGAGGIGPKVYAYLFGGDREAAIDLILFGFSYVIVAIACLIFLPEGHSFMVVGAAAIALFIASSNFELELRVGWVGCQQAAFVLVLFTVPLNWVPLVAVACMVIARVTSGASREHVLRSLCNSWYSIPAVLVLEALAPGRAQWSHGWVYGIAFVCSFVVAEAVAGIRFSLRGQHLKLREEVVPVSVDVMLTPIGLMGAVNAGSQPIATCAMFVGVTGLLAILGREHAERRTQTERALRDPLTGLPNRALFDEALEGCERRCARAGVQGGLLLLDLNDFKVVNDTYGHGGGDQVLAAFANRIRWSTRAVDTPARLGGDEFAIVLAEPISIEDAEAVAAKVHRAMLEPIELSGGERLTATAAIGAAVFGPGITTTTAMEHADKRLYEQKRARNPGARPEVRGTRQPVWPAAGLRGPRGAGLR